MADLQILGRVFGDKQLVAGLNAFGRQVRMRIYGALKNLARAYAQDVASSGLAEQGIQSRTGELRRSFVVKGRLSAAAARVLVYPNASDVKRKYRYPWALGQGSPKNEVTVRAHLREVPAGAKTPSGPTRRHRRRALYSERQTRTLAAAGAVRVAGYHRRVNMRPRPFMGGGAFTRLQADFGRRMEAAIAEAEKDAQQATQATGDGFDGAGVS